MSDKRLEKVLIYLWADVNSGLMSALRALHHFAPQQTIVIAI